MAQVDAASLLNIRKRGIKEIFGAWFWNELVLEFLGFRLSLGILGLRILDSGLFNSCTLYIKFPGFRLLFPGKLKACDPRTKQWNLCRILSNSEVEKYKTEKRLY